MTKPLSPNRSEINPVLITDEEIVQFENICISHVGSIAGSYRAALADFLNNRPELKLGKLRPIAEMSEKPPEGCFRVFAKYHRADQRWIADQDAATSDYIYATDVATPIPTPAPEAEDRQDFEEAMKGKAGISIFERNQDGSYSSNITEAAHTAWQTCKELSKAK